jgi:hypothetical protein
LIEIQLLASEKQLFSESKFSHELQLPAFSLQLLAKDSMFRFLFACKSHFAELAELAELPNRWFAFRFLR